MPIWPTVWVILAGFLIGSIPTGWMVARAHNVDIRTLGSGNIGATNVFRTLGKGAGVFVLGVDAFKGFAAVWILPGWIWLMVFPPKSGGPVMPEYLPMLAGFASILGHNYTPWLRFKGGKGIATSAGVVAGLMPAALGVALVVWLVIFTFSGYVSLASIVAAAALPFAVYWTRKGDWIWTGVAVLMAVLAIWKHRSNIQRLRAGTEYRFGRPAPDPKPPEFEA